MTDQTDLRALKITQQIIELFHLKGFNPKWVTFKLISNDKFTGYAVSYKTLTTYIVYNYLSDAWYFLTALPKNGTIKATAKSYIANCYACVKLTDYMAKTIKP